jgi:hypothetical protein
MSSIPIPTFDFHEMPNAFLCDNQNSNELRSQLIKNQVRIPEDDQTDLETVFFSDENIKLINKQLILTVYSISNKEFKIMEQSKDNLIIVMRYVFIEYARHLPNNITKQIMTLNGKVINEILPMIITNINQKLNYLKEINTPRNLLPLPENVTKSKTLKPFR